MNESMHVLDERRNERVPSREEIIKRETIRAMQRLIEHLPESYIAAEHAKSAEFAPHKGIDPDRLVESTYHPSQDLPREYLRYLAIAIKDIRDRYKNDPPRSLRAADIEKEAEAAADWIFHKSEDKLSDLNDAAIRSNASLDEPEIARIQITLVERLGGMLVNFEKKFGWSAREHFPHLMRAVPQGELQNELRKIVDGIRVEPNPDRFDETWETVIEAKTVLLDGVVKEHYVWIDYDGAKRAEGHIYSKYAALIYEDIQRNHKRLSHDERDRADALYRKFLENTSLNHAITSKLKDLPKDDPMFTLLEGTLTPLKGERYEQLEQLLGALNQAKRVNAADGRSDVIYLSDRVKFMPRLDHKSIQSAIDTEDNLYKQPGEERQVDRGQYAMLHNILNQILEINLISRENGIAIPGVMVAEARGARDIILLRAELERLARRKSGEDGRDYTADLSLVPLFESSSTVTPESITRYLETMWSECSRDKLNGEARFKREINEVFIAGSDLSKEVGQLSALVMAWDAAAAVVEFNRTHATDVRVKLGTGEAPFRQGGFWDPEAYLPLVRGRIARPKDLDAEQTRIVEKERGLLQRIIGPDWEHILVRRPRGFNRLFRLFPFNSFTNQSWSKMQTLSKIDTDRLRRMHLEAGELHQSLIETLKGGRAPKIPEPLRGAASHERDLFQSIYGKNGVQKTMFGQLLQFCATSLPMPQLRDRGPGRDRPPEVTGEFFDKLAEPYVDARAISANTASGYLFPLYLLGKGSALKSARKSGTLSEVLHYLDAKELLREMKVYGEIADDVFAMLRESGMEDDAATLKAEWDSLLAFRPVLRDELWRQENLPQVDASGKTITRIQKSRVATTFVSGTRELFDNDFKSDRTQLFKDSFGKHKGIIAAAMKFVAAGNALAAATNNDPARSSQEYRAALGAFEAAKSEKDAIAPEEYRTFLSDMVTAYSPGM